MYLAQLITKYIQHFYLHIQLKLMSELKLPEEENNRSSKTIYERILFYTFEFVS